MPVGEETSGADLQALIKGFEQARERFRAAILQKDSLVAFHALFEALAWTYTIDEKLRRAEGTFRDQPELRGLRYARHCVHHQWADALELDERGAQLPTPLPFVFFEWRWRENLPPPDQRKDEQAYMEHLAGRPARLALDSLSQFLRSLPEPGS